MSAWRPIHSLGRGDPTVWFQGKSALVLMSKAAASSLRGRKGTRIVTLVADGSIFCYLGLEQYPSIDERDRFID